MKIPKTPTVGIVGGKGKMGTYFAEVFKKAGCEILISDRHTKLTNKDLASTADVVVISVPINQTQKVIREIVPRIKHDSLLVDLTSIKEMPVKEMLKCKGEVVGLHPMFGETNPLKGQTIIAWPARGEKWFNWLMKVFTEQGAKIEILSPKEHDNLMGVIQGLVHFVDIAFTHTLKDLNRPVKEYLKYASPAYELKVAFAGRLIAQNPELYADIQLQNPQTGRIIKTFLKNAEKLFKIEQKGDTNEFIKYFKESGDFLGDYKKEAFDDTNYLIYAILNRRKDFNRAQNPKHFKNAEIATLGPRNTFSDLAASKYFSRLHAPANSPKKPEKPDFENLTAYFHSIKDIFEAVEKGSIPKGIVPLENLLHGTVRETYDCLYDHKVIISEKFVLAIRHALVGAPGARKSSIKKISSHIQALSQCKKYIKKNFPRAEINPGQSTMASYERIIGENDKSTAAIVPLQVAEKLKLNILDSNIGDSEKNRTSFAVIEKGSASAQSLKSLPTSAIKKHETSIAFTFSKDKPGSLSQVFNDFASAKINLSKIESRPSRRELGNYVFFLDFEGHISEQATKLILKTISKKVATLKLLGSYLVW